MAEEQWHLSKSIPISIITFLAAQSIAVVIWGVKLDSRVLSLEKADASHEARLNAVEGMRDKMILIEERQNVVIRRLDSNAKKLDAVLDEVTKRNH